MAFSSVCLCLCFHMAFFIRTLVTGFGFLIRTPICFPTYPNHISILEQEPIVISPFCGWLGSAGQFVLGPLLQLQLLLLSQDQVVSAALSGDMSSHLVFGMWTVTASPFTGAVHLSNIYQVGRGVPQGEDTQVPRKLPPQVWSPRPAQGLEIQVSLGVFWALSGPVEVRALLGPSVWPRGDPSRSLWSSVANHGAVGRLGRPC